MENAKKIVVIEDEPSTLRAVVDELISEGFDVKGAKDGEEGLALVLAEHPNLVLIDIILPRMNGMVVMKKIREDAWGRRVPIILLTSLEANDKIMQGVTEDEPSFYLTKSNFTLQEVVSKVKETLNAAPTR